MKPPRLFTERLVLRGYTESDRAAFVALNTDPVVRRHMDGAHTTESAGRLFDRVQTRASKSHGISWAIALRPDGRYAGHVFLSRSTDQQPFEIGVVLRRELWGRGYGPEAAAAVIQFAFNVWHEKEVVATVDPDHAASVRFLEKTGMTPDREDADEQGKFLVYSIERAC